MKMVIREATVEDVPGMMPVASAFHEASPYRGLAFDEGRCDDFLTGLLSSGKIWLADDEGKIVGGIGGLLVRPYFSAGLIAQEMFWFLDGAVRGGLTAGRLYRKFEAWAREEQADMLAFSGFCGARVEGFYRRAGLAPGETSWWKEL